MGISNINTLRTNSSVGQISKPTSPPPVKDKRPTQQDRHESVMIELSERAREMQRAEENKQTASEEHSARIEKLNRTDQAAAEKIDSQIRSEARALEERRRQNAQEYKRINTYA